MTIHWEFDLVGLAAMLHRPFIPTCCSEPSAVTMLLLQVFNSTSSLIMKGSASILSGLQVYQTKEWVLRSWRDVFVDLVQGQLQFLFLSLLSGTGPVIDLLLQGCLWLRCSVCRMCCIM